jgi:hypothetical protein
MSKGDKDRTKNLESYRSSPLWDKIGKDKKKYETYTEFSNNFFKEHPELYDKLEDIKGENLD